MKQTIWIINILYFCAFFNQPLIAQKAIQKAINKAISTDEIRSGKYYYAELSARSKVSKSDLISFCKEKYLLRKISQKKLDKYGVTMTIVTSFEFRDLKDIKREAAEKHKKALIRKKEREDAEAQKRKLEKDNFKIDELDRETNDSFPNNEIEKDKTVETFSKNEHYQNYDYNFEVISETKLPKQLHLWTVNKNESNLLVSIFQEGKMYTTSSENKTAERNNFKLYKANKEGIQCYFIDGFNVKTQEKEHFLIEPMGGEMYLVYALSYSKTPWVMFESNQKEFEKVIGTENLYTFYENSEYPIITTIINFFHDVRKVELSNNFYYTIDNSWSFSKELSCFDKCYSCDLFGGKGNKEVHTKDVRFYCEGKLIGEYKIAKINACFKKSFSLINFNSSNSGRGNYNSELDTIKDLVKSYFNECTK